MEGDEPWGFRTLCQLGSVKKPKRAELLLDNVEVFGTYRHYRFLLRDLCDPEMMVLLRSHSAVIPNEAMPKLLALDIFPGIS